MVEAILLLLNLAIFQGCCIIRNATHLSGLSPKRVLIIILLLSSKNLEILIDSSNLLIVICHAF